MVLCLFIVIRPYFEIRLHFSSLGINLTRFLSQFMPFCRCFSIKHLFLTLLSFTIDYIQRVLSQSSVFVVIFLDVKSEHWSLNPFKRNQSNWVHYLLWHGVRSFYKNGFGVRWTGKKWVSKL